MSIQYAIAVTTTIRSTRFINQDEINEVYQNLSPTHGGSREDYFGVVYISKKFNIPLSEAAKFVILGQKIDAGIDAYYHDEKVRTFYLYVFRWSADHMSFKVALEKLGNLGINKIFFDPTKSDDDHRVLIALKTCLFQHRQKIDHVAIDFVFNGDPVDAEQSKILGFLRESIEDKRGFVESCLSRPGEPEYQHDIVFHYISNVDSFGNISSSRESIEYLIHFNESLTLTSSNSQDVKDKKNNNDNTAQMTTTFLSLSDLYRMYNDLGERFFEKNLRSGLGDGSMTNIHIKDSLKSIVYGQNDPRSFTLYHNGITLTAQVLEIDKSNSIVRMVEPRILNGAQTVMILKQFIEEEAKKNYRSAASKSNGNKKREKLENTINNHGDKIESDSSFNQPDMELNTTTMTMLSLLQKKLAEVNVLARIIQTTDEKFLKQVTINNNRQNPIMPWNLRANDLLQISFEESFARLGIYYERRENSYKNLLEEDAISDSSNIDGEKGVVEIRKFAQTLLAAQGKIDRISEIREVFENERWYRDVFKEQYLQIDLKKLILLYKVQFRLQSMMREIRNTGLEKYGYVSKAKNLLWCLCIQGLMNESKFDKYVDMYGTSTNIEASLTEILKKLSTGKLRFILGDTFENKKYLGQMSEGRYSFLRSSSTLADCLKAAQTRFDWKRQSL